MGISSEPSNLVHTYIKISKGSQSNNINHINYINIGFLLVSYLGHELVRLRSLQIHNGEIHKTNV